MSTQGKEKPHCNLEVDSKITSPKDILNQKKGLGIHSSDETLLKVGSEYIWLWVAIEPESRQIPVVTVSRERNMLIAEWFMSTIVRDYGKHSVSTDVGTWYPMACKFLKLKHHIHSSFEKSLM